MDSRWSFIKNSGIIGNIVLSALNEGYEKVELSEIERERKHDIYHGMETTVL